ncbi:MAG: 2-C-methyl-D-erythritol 2,4-cyclodiphosphate synthase [Alphaproteobacteria bacterium]
MSKLRHKTILLVAAAGRGTRFHQTGMPKQYIWLKGRPLLCHCLDRLLANPAIDGAMVVIGKKDKKFYHKAIELCHYKNKILPAVLGGNDRQASVYCGLKALKKYQPKKVLIHDAARPYVDKNLLARIIKKLSHKSAIIPTMPLNGALKQVVGQGILASLTRQHHHIAETPQGFSYEKILTAHQQQQGRGLDDDAAVWQLTYPHDPAITIMGDVANIKITTPADIKLIENTMSKTISTLGVDMHRFENKNSKNAKMMLAGVPIYTKKNIIAHSDGDVIFHALTDALLGGIGMGDIGSYFPPSDAKWRGVASKIFVKYAMEMMKKNHARLLHIDITLLLESPKITPYRKKIIANLSKLLGLPPTSIGFKATTSEKMGAIGRGEGVMAMVQSTIDLPNEMG